jgi:RNA 3'-terminal phosphate cyclase (ATP)
MLNRIGIKVEPSINRYGFYPKGGGEVNFRIFPPEKIKGLNIISRGKLLSIHGYSGVSRLPVSIAERQENSMIQKLYPLSADVRILDVPSVGAGTFVFLKGEYENTLIGFSSLGKRGKPAENVGKEAAEQFKDFHNTPACLDPYLSDQIVIYLSLFRKDLSQKRVAATFTTSRITQHLLTNLWVVEKFLKINYQIDGEIGSEGMINICNYLATNGHEYTQII